MTSLPAAWRPHLTAEELDEYANHPNDIVRRHTAANVNTSVDTLLRLARDKDSSVVLNAIHNFKFPDRELELALLELAKTKPRIVLNHRKRTPEMLAIAAKHHDVDIRVDVAKNIDTPMDTLRTLKRDWEGRVRRAALSNPMMTSKELMSGISDTESLTRGVIAKHRNCTDAIAAKLMHDESITVVESLVANDHLGAEVRAQAAEIAHARVLARRAKGGGPVRERAEILSESPISKKDYARLANDRSAGIRVTAHLMAYEHGFISLKQLKVMLQKDASHNTVLNYLDLIDPFCAVEFLVTTFWNGHLPEVLRSDWWMNREVAKVVLTTRMGRMAWDVAQWMELDTELLDMMVNAGRLKIMDSTPKPEETRYPYSLMLNGHGLTFYPQLVVAEHPDASDEAIEIIRKSSSPYVKAGLVARMSPDELEVAAKDKMYQVRGAVARNPKTPEWVLVELSFDADVRVRQQVLASPNATEDLKIQIALLGV